MPPLSGSSTAPRLVGRATELQELVGLLGVRRDDDGPAVADPVGARTLLLAGDAGVGKTRLLGELGDVALEAGWQVVVGHCLDFGQSALPYLPFSEVIGRLAADRPELVDGVVGEHPALARLSPGRRLLGDATPPDPRSLDDDVERGALFTSVHALLETAGAEQPMLLVVEDVHWADHSSRDLLRFLFSRPFASRVSLVASYRSDDLHRRHPLRRQVAEWGRIPGVARLQLAPLEERDVRTLVGLLHPDPLSEPDVAGIVSRAEGNAFFVEELVGAAWSDGAEGLPDDLADLLLLRLDRLDEVAQQVVRAAAVSGRRVGHDLLAAASGLSADALDAGLREAIGHNVLVPVGADAYRFRHALLAEAVYDDLLPGERTRLHAAFAEALSSGRARGTAAELAGHARAARDLETAVAASVRAGDEARSVGGPDEAAGHYETALDLLADPSRPSLTIDDGEIDAALLAARAVDALTAAGSVSRALALGQELLAGLAAAAPAESRAHLLGSLVSTVIVAETTLDPRELSARALSLVPDEPSETRARTLHLHARALSTERDNEQARDVAVEALTMAEQLGLDRVASDVLTTLAALDRDAGVADLDLERSFEHVAQVAREAGAVVAELRAIWLLGRWRYDRAEFVESGEAFARATRRAEEVGEPWGPYGFDARFAGLQVAYVCGRWEEALQLADVSGQQPPPAPGALLEAAALAVRAGRGEVDGLSVAQRIRPLWEQDGSIPVTAGPAAIELHGVRGDREAALAEHDDVATTLEGLWGDRVPVRVRLAAVTIAALSPGIAEEPAGARERWTHEVDRLRRDAEVVRQRLRDLGMTWGPEGEAWDRRLHAEHLRFHWRAGLDPPGEEELVAAWHADLEGFEAMHHVVETARSQARLAEVLEATGATDQARDLAEAARETADRLGAAPLLAELGPHLRARTGAATSSSASPDHAALTRREREILALVAAGRTNGEIGTQLFIATKTVSVHVSNILAKLDATSRTEAAAIARRERLLD